MLALALLLLGLGGWLWRSWESQGPDSQGGEPSLRFVAPRVVQSVLEPVGARLEDGGDEAGKVALVRSRLEENGETLDERFTVDATGAGGTWEFLLSVPQLDYPVKVARRVEFDSVSGAERTVGVEEMVADRVIVRVAEGVDLPGLRVELGRLGFRLGRRLMQGGVFELFLGRADLDAVGDALDGALAEVFEGEILYLEPDYIVQTALAANDPEYGEGELWGLDNDGSDGGVADVDIDAPEAWDIRTSTDSVVVAVIDSGINYKHEDLRDNVWVNVGEVAGNGVDDDGNGYVDDVFGIDAVAESGDPWDENGHGSHCSGTIGASGNNSLGISGVAWKTRLMGLKFISSGGSGAVSDAIECIDYAVTNGAKVLNCSWGGAGYSEALRESIEMAGANGVLLVAAAGNSGQDLGESSYYPACYDLENIVSVAAVDRSGELAEFSNYGVGFVDVAAPGVDILSSLSGDADAYGKTSGTSMAAPHASGIAALVMAEYPDDSLASNINRLKYGATELDSLLRTVGVGGMVNARASLEFSQAPFPAEFARRPELEYYHVSGDTLRVEVEVVSQFPEAYRWFKDDAEIEGVEGSVLEIENLDTGDSGEYRVEIDNGDWVSKAYFSVALLSAKEELALAVDLPKREFVTWGQAGWEVYYSDSIVGATSIRSGDIGDEEFSVLRTRIRGPGLVSFYWRLSAERGWDIGEFRVDGELNETLWIEGDWSQVTLRLEEAREYFLEWRYEKDGSRSVGQDSLFLDGLSFYPLAESPPVIEAQPSSAVVGPGIRHDFQVAALGDGLRYQWFFDGQAIEGEEGAVLSIAEAAEEDAGEYRVLVSNAYGSVTSEVATLQVAEVPVSVLQSPSSQVRETGQSVRLEAEVAGALPIRYQWFKDGAPLAGETRIRLDLENLSVSDAGEYFLRVSSGYSPTHVDSDVAVLEIRDVALKPVIVKNPQGGYWQVGERFRLSVAAEGSQPFTYEWYKDGVLIETAGERFVEKFAEPGDRGRYRVLVQNAHGRAWSETVEVVIVAGIADALDLPGLEWELSGGQYFFAQTEVTRDGEDALQASMTDTLLPQRHEMSATVVGPINFSVYWKQEHDQRPSLVRLFVDDELQAALSGASDWRLARAKIPAGEHRLRLVVLNELGSRVFLDEASLSPLPTIYEQPQSKVLLAGDELELRVDAFGEGDLGYEWFRDGQSISGATGSVYTNNGDLNDLAGNYQVSVRSDLGEVLSEIATVEGLESFDGVAGDGSVAFALGGESDWEIWRDEDGLLGLRSKRAEAGESRRLEAVARGPGVLVMQLAATESVCCSSFQIRVDGDPVSARVVLNGLAGDVAYRENYYDLSEGDHLIEWVFTAADFALAGQQFGYIGEAKVTTEPIITREPFGQRLLAGETAEFSVALFDDEGASIVWYREADGVEVGTGKTLLIENLAVSDEGAYYCEVTNGLGERVRSRAAHLEVVEGFEEVIELNFGSLGQGAQYWEPRGDEVWAGAEVLGFRASDAPLTSTLRLSLDPVLAKDASLAFGLKVTGLGNDGFVEVMQEGGKRLRIYEDREWSEFLLPLRNSEDDVLLNIVKGNSANADDVGVWVDGFELVRYPVIYDDLENRKARYGELVSLEATVVGPDLQYQWYFEGRALEGETNARLSLRAGFGAVGEYQLLAKNGFGEVASGSVSVSLAESWFGQSAERPAAFRFEGDEGWRPVSDEATVNGDALSVSGIRGNERSDLLFEAWGPGTLMFDWKLESSRNGEQLYCYIQDVLVSGLFVKGEWRTFGYQLPESRRYPVRVSMFTLYGDETPGGRAWVDNVRFAKGAGNDYSDWAEERFADGGLPLALRGREANADGDGLANGAEYLLRMDPLSPELFPAPEYIETNGSLRVYLRFKMDFEARDGRVGFEISEDLRSWYPMSAGLLQLEPGGDDAILLARVPDADGQRGLFARLVIYFDAVE